VAESAHVIALDPWAERVAARIAGARPNGLCVVMAADAPGALERLCAACAPIEARAIRYLTVLQARDGLWIGPVVVPEAPGCVSCWRARRRQHDCLQPLAEGCARLADERIVARAVLAVCRRVLAAPASEAGVVRRFRAGHRAPDIGRVVPVTGCERCDSGAIRTDRWSLVGDPASKLDFDLARGGET
jgi:hypothetical protein